MVCREFKYLGITLVEQLYWNSQLIKSQDHRKAKNVNMDMPQYKGAKPGELTPEWLGGCIQ